MTRVQEKQALKRKDIIEAIIPMIETRPFEEISVEDICNRAGISVGSFYHYFEKKSDILVGLFSRIDSYMEKEAFPLMNSKDETENLRVFARSWLSYIESNGLEHSRLISSINATDFTINGEERSSAARLQEHFARGQKQGVLDASQSAKDAAALFMIALRGLALDWTRRNAAYPLMERGEIYTEYLIKAARA